MTRQATYQSGEEPLPGDLVRRTGENAMGLVKGEEYRVSCLDDYPNGWVMFDHVPEASFAPRGFSLVQRTEGKS